MAYEQLSDELLISAYHQAKKLELDPKFLELLEEEMVRRKIYIK